MEPEARVSCRHVGWLFPMALRRRIPRRHLLNHVDGDDPRLANPLETIEWDTFALILANLNSWLTDDELIEEAGTAWRDPAFQPWLAAASLMSDPAEQIIWAATAPGGPVASLPLSARIDAKTEGTVAISFTAAPSITPSPACFRIVAGMLRTLPAWLGSETADLHLSQGDSHINVQLDVPTASTWANLNRKVKLPFRGMMAAREFAALSGALAARDRQLAEADHELRRLKAQLDELGKAHAQALELNEAQAAANRQLRSSLDHQHEQLRTIRDAAFEAIIRVDGQGTIRDCNPAAAELLGLPSSGTANVSIENHLSGVLLLDRGEQVRIHLDDASTDSPATDGRRILDVVVLDDGDGAIVLAQDTTTLVQTGRQVEALEIQLQAAQRVESLGELTSGIAHDFNNLLVAINGYAQLGLGEPSLTPELREYFEEIRGAGDRAADMTAKLLTFARRQEIEPERVDLNALTHGIERIIERLLPRNIRTRFLRSLQAPVVLADPGQLEQVIINLCVNARDAMPDGGALTIAVGQRESVDESGRRTEHATIAIEDTGTGIPEEVANRIFEPFFTTKEAGKGTGLGLSVVGGIVERHGGRVDIASRPGEGTRFTITLPLASTAPIRPVPAPKSAKPATRTIRHTSETLLLIEDNRQVRELAARILEDEGYRVIAAGNGRDGIRVFERHEDSIHLVITDIDMPGATGEDVYDAVRTLQPETRFLFTTGYAEGSAAGSFIERNDLAVLRKPYTPGALCERIRSLLDVPA